MTSQLDFLVGGSPADGRESNEVWVDPLARDWRKDEDLGPLTDPPSWKKLQ